MRVFTDRFLVLRRVRHLEEDARVVAFLRDHGKTILTVRGAQRPASKLRVFQEPFLLADVQVFLPEHKHNGRLIGGQILTSHAALPVDFARYQTAARCCETVDALLPFRAPAPDVFDVLATALAALDEGAEPRGVWVGFAARLLLRLGHGDPAPGVTAEDVSGAAAFPGYARDVEKIGGGSEASLRLRESRVEARLTEILPRRLKSPAPAPTF